jgi:hypothetical protein
MSVVLLQQPAIESCIRNKPHLEEDLSVCSAGDLFLVLDRIRKDGGAGRIRADICNGDTMFHSLCNKGRIMMLTLSGSTLADMAFVDPYGEQLELDKKVFRSNAPEDSVRELNVKELESWGWEIK